eukprot:CAMPEP_0172516404 /NCGR_PEP_ID=MMETSP1066-20121228/276005_1 /TAXON_ID=671091 /ORGANISM="Coscinodiscus wailesii, Strain CCMP2513" /LENGTH=565 /DNA_ID=CAMNT_0013297873 /DNA_START=19 /DNA_END=1716 /DNA_ORIENTATION=+
MEDSTTLHQLCDAGNWDELLSYLETHSTNHILLQTQLTSPSGPHEDETPLCKCALRAPESVITELLALHPPLAATPDRHQRLPLHWAARRSTAICELTDPPGPDSEAVMRGLAESHPAGLVAEDDEGRTPLHVLFLHHGESRAVSTVRLLSATSGGVRPAMVPDREGRLPLHYAVGGGDGVFSQDVIAEMVNADPASVHHRDKKGRTALHVYLMAGEPLRVNEGGGPFPPARSVNVINLLLDGEVARLTDEEGRLPLHCAAEVLALSLLVKDERESQIDAGLGVRGDKAGVVSLRALKVIVKAYRAALVSGDKRGMTPLHLFLSAAGRVNEWAYERYLEQVKANGCGPAAFAVNRIIEQEMLSNLKVFDPPIKILELFCSNPLRSSSDDSPSQSKLSTVYDSDSSQSTSCAPNQPANRLAPETEEQFPPFTATCATKVEDEQGRLPLHYASLVLPSSQLLSFLLSRSDPTALLHADNTDVGRTPLHTALACPHVAPALTKDQLSLFLDTNVDATESDKGGGVVSGRLALKMCDLTGRYPLHSAAKSGAHCDILNRLIKEAPLGLG